MPLPEDVITTTVTGTYLDALGKPIKGTGVFTPDPTAISEGIVIAGTQVTKNLNKEGKFTVALPTSVDGGTNPDVIYQFDLFLDGGVYSRRYFQIPVSAEVIEIEDLVPMTPSPETGRFVLPARDSQPTNPKPGEIFYNTTTGDAEYWNAEDEVWVPLTLAAGEPPVGPAGGSLTGTYPNPTLAANSVGTAQIANFSITADKLTTSYVSQMTYNNDLATTALALGDLQEQVDLKLDINDTAPVLVLEANETEPPPGTPAGTVIVRKTT